MAILVAITAAITYFYGCGRLIRWGSRRAGQDEPTWWDIIGMLFFPAISRRATTWLIPDSLGWPEKWIAAGVSLVVLYLVLVLYFKIRLLDALLIWGLVLILALFMMLQVIPYLPSKPVPAGP
jgi:hypothetical protein